MAGPIKNIDFQKPPVFAILTFWNLIFVGQGIENGQNRFLERLLTIQTRWQDYDPYKIYFKMIKNDGRTYETYEIQNLRD